MPAPQHRPPGPSVASVAVMVSDREASKRWYIDRLGLDLLDGGDHWVTVGRKGNGGRIHLCQGTELGEGFPLEPGNTGILLVVPGDLRTRCRELEARGVAFSRAPEERPWGWDAEVRDPDGNLLLLMSEE